MNVFLTRFPEEESIVAPRSHCRNCDHVLTWWENLPLLSWILLRGRCRACHNWIGLRYPAVELAMALLWAACWLHLGKPLFQDAGPFFQSAAPVVSLAFLIHLFSSPILCWFLLALAILDAEFFWLPDRLTYPGILIGFLFTLAEDFAAGHRRSDFLQDIWYRILAIAGACGLILFIRLAYWIVRRQEGMGLGDAKLMALLGAWLGLRGALESFFLAVLIATFAALAWLAILFIRRKTEGWATMPLPFGTFLCLAALSEVFYPNWISNGTHLNILF
jgi:leader peptidase (prepilin peptidase)/N-methyltransferase